MSKSKSRSHLNSFWKSNYKPKRYPFWYGISGIQFIWRNCYDDPLLKRRSHVVNCHVLEDLFWSLFQDDLSEGVFRLLENESDEDAFVRYMRLHADDVRSEFDNLIKEGFTRWVRPEYVYADDESVVKFAC